MTAILSSDYAATRIWFEKEYNNWIRKYDAVRRTYTLDNGGQYTIISHESEARGMEFDSYVKSPDYYTLEDVVKTRIHKK